MGCSKPKSEVARVNIIASRCHNHKLGRVRIGPRMVEVLRRHRAPQAEERMRASGWEDPGLVFPNTKGKIRRRDCAVRSFRRYLEEASIPTDVRFHDLRHTAGTLALRQGMPLHAVSKMLGHSDPAMTLRRYAHLLEDMEDEGRAGDGRALLRDGPDIVGVTSRTAVGSSYARARGVPEAPKETSLLDIRP
jgi:integrase